MADSGQKGPYKPPFWVDVLFVIASIAVVYLCFRLMCGPNGCDYSQFPRDVHR